MKKLLSSIFFLVFVTVIIQYTLHPTPLMQINATDSIEYIRSFFTTPRSQLPRWFWENLVLPILKGLAFPFEMSIDYLFNLGRSVLNWISEFLDSDFLSKIYEFFDRIKTFFDSIWRIFPNSTDGFRGGR